MAKYYFINQETTSRTTYDASELSYIQEEISGELTVIVEDDVDVEEITTLAALNLPIHFLRIKMNELELSSFFRSQIVFKSCEIGILKLNNQFKITIEDSEILKLLISGESRYLSLVKTNVNTFLSKFTTTSLKMEVIECKVINLHILDSVVNLLKIVNSHVANCEVLESAIDELSLENFTIESIIIIESRLNNIDFRNSNSKMVAKFINSEIKSKIFFLNLMDSTIAFYDSFFTKDLKTIKFENNSGEVIFNGCSFSCSFKIYDRSNDKTFDHPYLTFYNVVFEKPVIFYDEQSKNMVLENVIFQQGVLIPLSLKTKSASSVHSSVWCALKHNALQSNNRILAMEYGKLEMNSYTNELKLSKGKIPEKVVLYLNKYSNNHGLSWTQGVLFTLAALITFYTLFVWSGNEFYFSYLPKNILWFKQSFWEGALSFLWLPSIEDEMKVLKSGLSRDSFIVNILSFLLGKIFIAFGIYQTVAAFRKHGKI
jgi:hypothetical protein